MSGERPAWPRGQEAAAAIAELANAMQTAAGWLDRMGADDLERLLERLAAMHRIALRRLVAIRPGMPARPYYETPPHGVAGYEATTVQPRCDWGGQGADPERCPALATRRVAWVSIGGLPSEAFVCEAHESDVRANLERLGIRQ